MADENRSCTKEVFLSKLAADVQVLKKDSECYSKKIDRMEVKYEDMASMNTAISVMSLSLEHIVEHNIRQDGLMQEQYATLEKINENLNRLNEGQNTLDSKVENLETRVTLNEELNNIDIRVMQKDNYADFFKKYSIPIGFGSLATLIIAELIRHFF